jgi:RecA-family ATPase
MLTRVAMVADGSIALISHPSLAGINTETGLSGSTQWHNSVRARQFLRGVKPEGGEPVDHDLREIVFKKNNYGPISESIILRWTDGLFLPVPGVTIDQAAREATAKHVFLSLLDRFIAANRDVGDKPGSNYAPTLFSKEDEAKLAKLSKKDLEGAMRQLFRDGQIVNEPRPGSRPSRPSYRIVPVKGG